MRKKKVYFIKKKNRNKLKKNKNLNLELKFIFLENLINFNSLILNYLFFKQLK